jgi:uncharacterized protein
VKYLLAFIVAALLAWRWRTSRTARQLQDKNKQSARNIAANTAVEMLICHHCGVHFPGTDAVSGAQGHYCSTAHLRAQEP